MKPEPPHASKRQAFRTECEKQTAAPRVDGRPQCGFPFCGCASYRFEEKPMTRFSDLEGAL